MSNDKVYSNTVTETITGSPLKVVTETPLTGSYFYNTPEPPTPPSKPWYESWTNLLNGATLAFLIAVVTLPQVAALIPDAWQPYVVAGVAIGNLFLRNFVTKVPISSSLTK